MSEERIKKFFEEYVLFIFVIIFMLLLAWLFISSPNKTTVEQTDEIQCAGLK